MTRRTTGLAGTFALVCAAHVATAQGRLHPRIGMVVPGHQNQPAQLSGTWVRPSRAAIRQQAPSGPRIAMIAPAPRASEQFNVRVDSRPRRRFPAQSIPDQMQPPRLQAAPRGLTTARGNNSRIGLIVPGPPAAQGQFSQTVFAPTQDFGFVQVAQFFFVPAVALTDGRVFANFNGRFEQVLRRCPDISGALPPGFTTSACWMIDSFGQYVVVQPR
jgi:hypothetical protein